MARSALQQHFSLSRTTTRPTQPACSTPAGHTSAGEDSILLPWFGRLRYPDIGLPLFTLAIGLLDGFNPCSMWVLILMISLLAPLNNRRRMSAIAGTFVAVQGIAYFAFMAAWLNLFLAVGMSDALRWLLGLVAIALLSFVPGFRFYGWNGVVAPRGTWPPIVQKFNRVMNEVLATPELRKLYFDLGEEPAGFVTVPVMVTRSTASAGAQARRASKPQAQKPRSPSNSSPGRSSSQSNWSRANSLWPQAP